MTTIPRTAAREKSLYGPFRAFTKLSQRSQLVVVQKALRDAQNRGDRGALLELASSVLAPTRKDRDRLRRWRELWPTRVNEDEIRGDLCCVIIANWSHASDAVRHRLSEAPPSLIARALRQLEQTDPLAVTDWLCHHPERVTLRMLRSLILADNRDASNAATGLFCGSAIAALGLADDPAIGDRLVGFARLVAPGNEDLESTIDCVANLVNRYEDHQQRDLMTLALLLAEGPGLATDGPLKRIASMFEEETPGTTGLRAAIRRGSAPFVRARAWRWLASEPVRAAAIDRINRAASVHEHEVVFREGYLVLRASRAATLRMIKVRATKTVRGQEPARGEALPTVSQRDALTPSARRWLLDCAQAMQLPEGVATQMRGAGLTDPHAWVRWAHQRHATPTELVDYVFDDDARVARSAALARSPAGGRSWTRWPIRRADQARLAATGHATRSPHKQVRAIACGDARRMNPWLVNTSEGRLAAREWLRSDRSEFLKAIRQRLEDGDESERVDAIKLARLLRIGVAIEPLLTAMADEGATQCRVAATAVSALGDVETPSAQASVRRALGASDVRVRANAVESTLRHVPCTSGVTSLDGQAYGSLIELKGDEHHRVRANALRGLIAGGGIARGGRVLDPSGVDGLQTMLTDSRDMHRLAAVWLAERTLVSGGQHRVGVAWDELSRRVAAMAVRDEASAVRTRALRCAKRLLAEIQVATGDHEEKVKYA